MGCLDLDLIAFDSDFKTKGIVENYDSLIWTERFVDFGEFELKSADVDSIRAALPLETPVKLADSRQVFLTENHSIEKDDNSNYLISVTGRSYDCIYERRIYPGVNSVGSFGDEGLSGVEMIGNIIDGDLFDGGSDSAPESFNPQVIGGQGAQPTTNQLFQIEPGNVADFLHKIQSVENIGVSPELLADSYLPTFPNTKIVMYIYAGIDLRSSQTTNPPVIFTVGQGQFDDANYLFSYKDYKNVAVMLTRDPTTQNPDNTYTYACTISGASAVGITGLARRELFVDCTDISIAGKGYANANRLLATRGRYALAGYNSKFFIQGEIAPNLSFKYGSDYNLGDLVTIVGNFGVKQDARIMEYIRTQDSSGETASPTLAFL